MLNNKHAEMNVIDCD